MNKAIGQGSAHFHQEKFKLMKVATMPIWIKMVKTTIVPTLLKNNNL